MFYVGLDIHSKHISICVLNEIGQLMRRSRLQADWRDRAFQRSDSRRALGRVFDFVRAPDEGGV